MNPAVVTRETSQPETFGLIVEFAKHAAKFVTDEVSISFIPNTSPVNAWNAVANEEHDDVSHKETSKPPIGEQPRNAEFQERQSVRSGVSVAVNEQLVHPQKDPYKDWRPMLPHAATSMSLSLSCPL